MGAPEQPRVIFIIYVSVSVTSPGELYRLLAVVSLPAVTAFPDTAAQRGLHLSFRHLDWACAISTVYDEQVQWEAQHGTTITPFLAPECYLD